MERGWTNAIKAKSWFYVQQGLREIRGKILAPNISGNFKEKALTFISP